MSPWLSDSEIGLFCKDPLISSLGGRCLADSWNTLDDQEPAGGVVCHTTIFLEAVLRFDQSQAQDWTWWICFPSETYKLAIKCWWGEDTWGPQPGLVWGMWPGGSSPGSGRKGPKLSWWHHDITERLEQANVSSEFLPAVKSHSFLKNLTPTRVFNMFWKMKCRVSEDPKKSLGFFGAIEQQVHWHFRKYYITSSWYFWTSVLPFLWRWVQQWWSMFIMSGAV